MYVSFFVFKHKTAYEMRISDWSSDVCSSDLRGASRVELQCSSRMNGNYSPVINGVLHRLQSLDQRAVIIRIERHGSKRVHFEHRFLRRLSYQERDRSLSSDS